MSWRDFSCSQSVLPRVSDWIICMTLGKTLSETGFFRGQFKWCPTKRIRVEKCVPERVLLRLMHLIRSETLGETLWHRKSRWVSLWVLVRISPRLSVRLFAPKSLGSDYMHDSRRDSLRDSFFYAGNTRLFRKWLFLWYIYTTHAYFCAVAWNNNF